VTTCGSCHGRGRFIDDPCTTCGGSGQVAEEESLTVRIPLGVEEGRVLRVPGKGMPAPAGQGARGVRRGRWKLSREQRKLWKRLRELESGKP
jgi:molecular chaperone DnaJ